jgi:hypothetical protein
MLDIIFYSPNNQQAEYVEVSEDLYEWLAKSKFSHIGFPIHIYTLLIHKIGA